MITSIKIMFLMMPIVFGIFCLFAAKGETLFNFVRGFFVYFLDTEILYKKEKSEDDINLIMRHLSNGQYSFTRRILFIKNADKVLSFLNDLNTYRQTYTTLYCKALVKVSEYDKSLYGKAEEILIEKSGCAYNNPEILLIFAREAVDLKISRKKLFVAVTKTGNKNLINKFANEFKEDKEIEKLLSLM